MKLAALFFSCLLVTLDATAEESPVVTLSHGGSLRGTLTQSPQTQSTFESYKGIPYAEPPLRFAPPVRHPGWQHQREAAQDGPLCLQPALFGILDQPEGQEDCLFLNVFTPSSGPNSSYPVMVFIHGGGYVFGSGSSLFHGPDFFMFPGNDVVLVTLNYRLGPLGFFSTGDSEAPGNWGMLDQVEALRWVQDNIRSFGGDPNRVTIFGQSAGAGSVALHLFSPLSRGLFHGAIAMSGNIFDPWAIQREPKENARKLAAACNCGGTDLTSKDILSCLTQKSAQEITLKGSVFYEFSKLPLAMTPTIDGEALDPFLPTDPTLLLSRGEVNRVPVMAGVTEHEGNFVTMYLQLDPAKYLNLHQDWNGPCRAAFALHSLPQSDSACQQIRESFFGVDKAIDIATMQRILSRATGERTFQAGMRKFIAGMSDSGVPTYAYNFEFQGQASLLQSTLAVVGQVLGNSSALPPIDILDGASHGDDLLYLFTGTLTPPYGPESEEMKMVKHLTTIWTGFAKNGSPPEPKWKPWTIGNPGTYLLSSEPKVSYTRFNQHTNEFWDSLTDNKENRNGQGRRYG